MEKLIKALEIRKIYNQMPFDEFIKEFEEWSGKTVSEEDKKSWKFTGLNNVDFLLNTLDKKSIIVIKSI